MRKGSGVRRPRGSALRRGPDKGGVGQNFPPRIPGVRVAYVGGRFEAVRDVHLYWQSRGTAFLHYAPESGQGSAALSRILDRADIVFHSAQSIGAELQQHLIAFCERWEKPLIPVHETSLSGLKEALGTWSPLA